MRATPLLAASLLLSTAAYAQCDLTAARSSIKQVGGFAISGKQACATFVNTSQACTFPVALEAFTIDPRQLFLASAQQYFSSQVQQLQPGQQATLCIPLPSCASQVDALTVAATQVDGITGPTGDPSLPLKQLTNDPLLGGRLIDGTVTGCFCSAPSPTGGCTYSQGYFKNHIGSLPDSLMLGTKTYSRTDLQAILQTPVAGNCLISLAYQLIAAKANIVVRKATPNATVSAAIQTADLLLGSTLLPGGNKVACSSDPLFGVTIDVLTKFNEGQLGVPHCPDDDSSNEKDDKADKDKK